MAASSTVPAKIPAIPTVQFNGRTLKNTLARISDDSFRMPTAGS
jgi:hypothetical protein